MVDDATVARPVESPSMESWEHTQIWRAHRDILERLSGTLRQLREEVGAEPRRLHSRAVIERISDAPRWQLYLPDLGVAGEGRCICEASLETVYALETILLSVLEHKDWAILPSPDRSLPTAYAACKTSTFLRLQRFLADRIGPDEAQQANSAYSALLTAVS